VRLLMVICMMCLMCSVVTASVGDTRIAKWKNDTKGAVTLNFDDSTETQATVGFPALAEKGLTGTFYINPGLDRYTNQAHIWETAPENHQELADHTMTHTGGSDYDDTEWEMGRPAEIIWEINGPDVSKLLVYATPGSGGSHQVSGDEFNFLMDKYHLIMRTNYYFPMDYGSMQNTVDSAINGGGWESFGFHGIGGDWIAVDTQTYYDIVDYIYDKRYEVWCGGHINV